VLLVMLREGRLHLSGIAKLAPHLTPENRDALLERAAGQSKRRIEELVAELWPRPDVPPSVRKLPSRPESPAPQACGNAGVPSPLHAEGVPTVAAQLRPDGVAPSPARPAVVEPLADALH
jgi:hypothetical protein